MTREELLKPRYKVIADFPKSPFKIGDVLIQERKGGFFVGGRDEYDCAIEMYEFDVYPYPKIFKPLQWWEERSIETLSQIKFVKVIKYRGYWRVGDIVAAKFYIGSVEKSLPTGFTLEYGHYQPLFELEPATKEEDDIPAKKGKQTPISE